MKAMPRAGWTLAVTLFLLGCYGGSRPKHIGDTAPDFTLQDSDHKVALSDYRGQVVVLNIWASWCPPCRKSFPVMEQLHKQYAGDGLTIVAVSVDEKAENMQQFLKLVKASFSVVRDAQQKLVAAADVPTMPTSFLIDRAGKIRFVHSGFDEKQTMREYVKEIPQLLKEDKP